MSAPSSSPSANNSQKRISGNDKALEISNSPSCPGLANLFRSSSPYVSPYAPISQSNASPSVPAPGTSSSTSSSASGNVKNTPRSFLYPQSPEMALTTKEKATLLQSLRTHRVNTLIELRRIEKTLSSSKTPDVTEAMTQAWAHYVNSNNLLSELRGLTKSYPFSSECLDEAKWMVISDSQSMKSWNYCWLVLQKARNQNLIPKHARQLAAKPAMWGGRTPSAKQIEQLASACTAAWTAALNQALRHWDSPPTI